MLVIDQGSRKRVVLTPKAPSKPQPPTHSGPAKLAATQPQRAVPQASSEHGQGGGTSANDTGTKPTARETQTGYTAPAAAQPEPAGPRWAPEKSGVGASRPDTATIRRSSTTSPHRPPETLGHAINRMLDQGFGVEQVAGQLHRWHPGWSTTRVASTIRSTKNPTAAINTTAFLPRTARTIGTPAYASAHNTPTTPALAARHARRTSSRPHSWSDRLPLSVGHDVTHVAEWVGHETAHEANALGLTARYTLPNPEILTSLANFGMAEYKIGTGVVLVTTGTAADVTGFAAILGLPAEVAGYYQLTTGLMRARRAVQQSEDVIRHPLVRKSPLRMSADLVIGIAPLGGTVTDEIGGLP